MIRIFLSYRREDSDGWTSRLADHLKSQFGTESIFMDIDKIRPGADFHEELRKALNNCDVLLAIIGRNWAAATDKSGKPSLDNPRDWVRVEIASALTRKIRVIPVLLDGASVPVQDLLPDDLQPLAQRQVQDLTLKRWNYDVDQLVKVLQENQAVTPPPLTGILKATLTGSLIATSLCSIVLMPLIDLPVAIQLLLIPFNLLFAWAFLQWCRPDQKLELKDGINNVLRYWQMLDVRVSRKKGHEPKLPTIKGKPWANKHAVDHQNRVNLLVEQFTVTVRYLAISFFPLYMMILARDSLSIAKSKGTYLLAFETILKIGIGLANLWGAYFVVLAFLVLYNKTLNDENKPIKFERRYWLAAMVISGVFVVVSLLTFQGSQSRADAVNSAITGIVNCQGSNDQSGCSTSPIFGAIIEMRGTQSTRTQEEERENLNAIQLMIKTTCSKLSDNHTRPSSALTYCDADRIKSLEKAVDKAVFFPTFLNLLQLLIGCLAGLSFSLLFSRYISMEYQFGKMSRSDYPKWFRLVIIGILPIYALVQPLFGAFDITAFGSPAWFTTVVLFLCLVGKGFFFGITWYFVEQRLLHYYLHLVLANHGVPKDFDKCFNPSTS